MNEYKYFRGQTEYIVEKTGYIRYFCSNEIMKTYVYNGYKYVKLWLNGKLRKYCLHRIVAEAYINNPFNYPGIIHNDNDVNNNHISNLRWCSKQEYDLRMELNSKLTSKYKD